MLSPAHFLNHSGTPNLLPSRSQQAYSCFVEHTFLSEQALNLLFGTTRKRLLNFHHNSNEFIWNTIYQWMFRIFQNILRGRQAVKNLVRCLQQQSILSRGRLYLLFQQYCGAGHNSVCAFFLRKYQSNFHSLQLDSITFEYQRNSFCSCNSATKVTGYQRFLFFRSILILWEICSIMFRPHIT